MRIKRTFTILVGAIISTVLMNSQVDPYTESGQFVNFFFPVPVPNNGTTKDIISPSPKVASLGIFGQIPVGNFTGTATINIPIYTVNYKELMLPVAISYNTIGNKPDIFPGPVGMGWGFQAGGMITRKSNGFPDTGDPVMFEFESYPPGKEVRHLSNWYDLKIHFPNVYSNEDWSNAYDPDEFSYNINGQTGSFYLYKIIPNNIDTIMVMSNQGEFFKVVWHKRENLNYKLFPNGKPDQLNYAAVNRLFPYPPYTYNNYPHNPTIEINNWINGFTMIDSKGIKYNFGNQGSGQENDNAIEFTRLGHDYYSFDSSIPISIYDYSNYFKKFVQASTWHLTSIESPNGYSINLKYNREYYVTNFRFTDFAYYSTTYLSYYLRNTCWRDAFRRVFINGSYLTEIEFPDGILKIENSEATGQLDYSKSDVETQATSYKENRRHLNQFYYYPDIGFANIDKISEEQTDESFLPHKVDSILVYDVFGVRKRAIYFDYTNSEVTRLKLLSLTISGKDVDYNTVALKYKFEYEQDTLPKYLSNMTDYYGFYNGKKLFEGYNLTLELIEDNPIYYNTKKSPDFNFAKAEILRKITYPTGGYSILEYEPHDYGKVFMGYPYFVVRDASEELDLSMDDAGGLRISSVKNYDKQGAVLNSKEYIYKTSTSRSSGILAYGSPNYVDRHGSSGFTRISSNPALPMPAGSHVTYSEVKIIEGNENGNSGYTVYKYKNYDNGFGDKPLKGYNNTFPEFYADMVNVEGISMKIERGQPLCVEIYNNEGEIVKRTDYFYNSKPERFNESVRFIRKIDSFIKLRNLEGTLLSAGEKYTYYPYLLEKSEELFFGKGDSLVSTAKYEYNETYRLLKSAETKDSRGDILKNKFFYPFDDNTTIYNTMTDSYMLNYPVRSVSKKNSEPVLETKTEYKQFSVDSKSLIQPYKEYVKRGNSPMTLESIYNEYDKIGNPLSITDDKSGEKICYLWSYKGNNPVAKIVGLDYNDVKNILSEEAINNLWNSLNPELSDMENIHTTLSNAGALVTIYTYKSLTGMVTETDFRGITTYYEYDGLGRLTEIKVGKKNAPDDNNETKIKVETDDYHYSTTPATLTSYSIIKLDVDYMFKLEYLGCSDLIPTVKITVIEDELWEYVYMKECTGTALISFPVLIPAHLKIIVTIEFEGNKYEDSVNIYIPGE